MGYYSGTFYSKALEMDTQLGVILPQDSRKHNGVEPIKEGVTPSPRPKTLILLHGLGDNYLTWLARTSILRYAEEYDVAVLMPEVARSFYQDMKYGRNYFTYITSELPEYASSVFHISTEPRDLMIAGLSMGGYGALKCALTYPEKYAGAGVFSSAWNIQRLLLDGNLGAEAFSKDEIYRDCVAMWGHEEKIPQESDIIQLMEHAKIPPSFKLYTACGTEDFLYEDHQELKALLKEHNIAFADTELPGCHEWAVWDRVIQQLLDYFIRGNVPAKKLE